MNRTQTASSGRFWSAQKPRGLPSAHAVCATPIIGALLVWAMMTPSAHEPATPPAAGIVLAAIAIFISLGTFWMRRRFGVLRQTEGTLPSPAYTLYLAAMIVAGLPDALLIVALTSVVDELLEWRIENTPQPPLVVRAAEAMLITFLAGLTYALGTIVLMPHLSHFEADLVAALAACIVMLIGIGSARVLTGGTPGLSSRLRLAQTLTSPAFRFQLLLLSVGPLLPLAELVDDVVAEFAWALFLVPLGAVYYLALMSTRLQQQTTELRVTVSQLVESRQREAELTGYAAAVTRAQEDERRRLARELHDDTLQALVALARGLDTLSAPISRGFLASQDAHFVEELGELAKRTLESVRRACQDLRPSVLDDLGLAAALASLAQSVSRRGLHCSFREQGMYQPYRPELEVTVYRIAQEALTNSEKHAHATKVDLTIAFHHDHITLEIRDDGCGFDYSRALRGAVESQDGTYHKQTNLGILGMRERASLVRAQLVVTSAPGDGTSIELVVPLTEAL